MKLLFDNSLQGQALKQELYNSIKIYIRNLLTYYVRKCHNQKL